MSNPIDFYYRIYPTFTGIHRHAGYHFCHEAVVVYWTFYNLESQGEVSHAEYCHIFWHIIFPNEISVFCFFILSSDYVS